MKIPSHESDLCYFFTSYVDTDSIKLYEFSNIVRNCNDVCSKTDFICLPSIALIFWMQYFEWIHNDHTLFRSSVWLKNINEKYKKKKANLLCTGGLLKCYVAFDSYWTCCWNVMLPLAVTGHVESVCRVWDRWSEWRGPRPSQQNWSPWQQSVCSTGKNKLWYTCAEWVNLDQEVIDSSWLKYVCVSIRILY